MDLSEDITAVYEDGVFKPDERCDLPDRTRVRIRLQMIEVSPEEAAKAQHAIETIRRSGALRTTGWKFNRDELHERR